MPMDALGNPRASLNSTVPSGNADELQAPAGTAAMLIRTEDASWALPLAVVDMLYLKSLLPVFATVRPVYRLAPGITLVRFSAAYSSAPVSLFVVRVTVAGVKLAEFTRCSQPRPTCTPQRITTTRATPDSRRVRRGSFRRNRTPAISPLRRVMKRGRR